MDTAGFVLCRTLHDAGLLQAFGVSVFAALLLPAGLRHDLEAPLRRLLVGALLLAAITLPLWLGFAAAGMMDDGQGAWGPSNLWTVLVDTQFGQVWIGRAGLTALALGLAMAMRETPTRPVRGRLSFWVAMALATGLLLASLGRVGHALLPPGAWSWVHGLNHALHVLASGFWLGALAPLLWVLRRLDAPDGRQDCGATLRRFSEFGHAAVMLVLMTGLINTRLVLGAIPTDLSTAYRQALALKLVLVFVMAGLAVYNRYWLVPDMRKTPAASLRALRRNTATGLAIGFVVLGVTSLIGMIDPL